MRGNLHDGFWILSSVFPFNGTMSSNFWKLLGYSQNELQFNLVSWQSLVNGDDLSLFMKDLKNFVKKWESEDSFAKEIKFIHKNGSDIWMDAKGAKSYDAQGNPVLLIALTNVTKYISKQKSASKKLKLYESIIDGTHTGTWEWNAQTQELRLNEHWAQIIGYTLEELEPVTEEKYRSLVHPEDLEKATKLLERHFKGQVPFYESETRMKHKKGHWVWIYDKGKIISHTSDGKPEWIAGSHQDITKQKENHLALLHYKNLLERSNEAAKIGTWEFNLENGRLDWCKTTKGIHEVESTYQPTVENAMMFYKEGDNLNLIKTKFENCINKGEKYDLEVEIKTAKGNNKWVRAIGIPIFENNKCTGLYGLMRDITDRIKATKIIAFKEEQLSKTFEYAANGMSLVDLDGTWLRVNKSLCDMLGYSKEEFINLKFQDLTHKDDLNIGLKFKSQLISGETEFHQTEKRYIHKDGSIVWAFLAVSLVKSDVGEPLHFVAQITNITEKKKGEIKIKSLLNVANEQNKRLVNFAHIASHNLRSHSANFTMLLDLMKDDIPEATDNEYFPLLNTAASNLNETITQLNEVVSINKQLNEKLRSVNLRKTIEKVMVNIASNILKTGFIINIVVDEDVTVKAIPAYLDSIILNLLTNAIKYRNPQANSFLNITATSSTNYIDLKFEDNGIGIDLELYGSKVFGLYKTFHNNEDSQGVGLFISKNQIEVMKGTIDVESEVNKGTTFLLRLKK